MSLNHDEVRRLVRGAHDEHSHAVGRFRELLDRLFSGEDRDGGAMKRAVLLGGVDRRGFFRVGGLTVASAAVLAACGETGDDETEATTTTSGPAAPTERDITILRTATSIENLAIQVYTRAIDGGLVATAAVKDAMKLFRDHHEEHAELLKGATANAEGTPFTEPNPVLLQQLTPTIQALRDERGVVQVAFDLEQTAAATYQASAGRFTATRLNETVMSIGGVEARHGAILAAVLGQSAAPKAFFTTETAVAAGTGV